MTKKNPQKKRYTVNLSMKYSHDIEVTATGLWQARTRAFLKLLGKLTQKDFTFYVDEKN